MSGTRICSWLALPSTVSPRRPSPPPTPLVVQPYPRNGLDLRGIIGGVGGRLNRGGNRQQGRERKTASPSAMSETVQDLQAVHTDGGSIRNTAICHPLLEIEIERPRRFFDDCSHLFHTRTCHRYGMVAKYIHMYRAEVACVSRWEESGCRPRRSSEPRPPRPPNQLPSTRAGGAPPATAAHCRRRQHSRRAASLAATRRQIKRSHPKRVRHTPWGEGGTAAAAVYAASAAARVVP